MNITKTLIVVVALVSVPFSQEAISITKIDNNTCITSSKEQSELLKESIAMINEMKKLKSEGRIDSTIYDKNVASVLKDARQNGVRIIKNN